MTQTSETTASATPRPQGKYVPATRHGDIIFTAGMTPRRDGTLIMAEKVRTDEPLERYRESVRQAASNALAAAKGKLAPDEKICQVLQLMVYINAEQGFTAHAKFADFASEFLAEELGVTSGTAGSEGTAARAAIGVGTLPGNAPVEIMITCAAGKN